MLYKLNWSIEAGTKASGLTAVLKDRAGTVIFPTSLGITLGK